MFLKEFTGDLPWAHLDIAGTAWADEAKPYHAQGASGVAVRTLAELAFATTAAMSQWLESRSSLLAASCGSTACAEPFSLALMLQALGNRSS